MGCPDKDFSDETYVEGMQEDKKTKGLHAKLKIMNGLYKNKIIIIDKANFTVGRSKDCNLNLYDQKISRIHAQFTESMGKMILEDLGSSNGTLVNGHKVTKKILNDGDMIQVGNTSLLFLLE